MTLRNFHIDCKIDGRESKLLGGPKAKDGGFKLTIYQRSDGKIITALNVIGWVDADGKLLLEIDTHEKAFPISPTQQRLLTKQ